MIPQLTASTLNSYCDEVNVYKIIYIYFCYIHCSRELLINDSSHVEDMTSAESLELRKLYQQQVTTQKPVSFLIVFYIHKLNIFYIYCY